jgi:hypothetical protein
MRVVDFTPRSHDPRRIGVRFTPQTIWIWWRRKFLSDYLWRKCIVISFSVLFLKMKLTSWNNHSVRLSVCPLNNFEPFSRFLWNLVRMWYPCHSSYLQPLRKCRCVSRNCQLLLYDKISYCRYRNSVMLFWVQSLNPLKFNGRFPPENHLCPKGPPVNDQYEKCGFRKLKWHNYSQRCIGQTGRSLQSDITNTPKSLEKNNAKSGYSQYV